MQNDGPLGEGKILQPDVLEMAKKIPASGKNLITVMVLSVTLAHQVLGKEAPKKGKMNPGQGKKVIQAIEKAVKSTFPDVAPMILGMFGLEMLSLMPMLNEPDKIVQEMIADYTGLFAQEAPVVNDAAPSPVPNLG